MRERLPALNRPCSLWSCARRRCLGPRAGCFHRSFGGRFNLEYLGDEKWPWVKIQIVPPVNIPIPTKTDLPQNDAIGFGKTCLEG